MLTLQDSKVCQEVEALEKNCGQLDTKFLDSGDIVDRRGRQVQETKPGVTDYPSHVSGTGDGTAKRAATSSSSGWAMHGPGVTAVASLHQPAVEEKQLSDPPAFPCAWTKRSPQSSSGILQKMTPF